VTRIGKCRHPHRAEYQFWVPIEPGLVPRFTVMLRAKCVQCKAWVGMGSSSDEDPRVMIEIRAVEIADVSRDSIADAWLAGRVSDCERDGWVLYAKNEEPDCGAEESGYLARCICSHEEEAL
jgi:hypothetical protein